MGLVKGINCVTRYWTIPGVGSAYERCDYQSVRNILVVVSPNRLMTGSADTYMVG